MKAIMCKNHPEIEAYIIRIPLCEDCLAETGQQIVDSGLWEGLAWWAHEKNYNWHQAMVRLGMAYEDGGECGEKFGRLINTIDAQYTEKD